MAGLWLGLGGLLGLLAGVAGQREAPDPTETPQGDAILSINRALTPLQAPGPGTLLEGDIVRADPSRAFAAANPKWPKRRGLVWIPYMLSERFDPSSTRVLEEALGDLARLTCVRFVPRAHQRDFVVIAPMGGCFSSVGRAGGPQLLSLAPPCLQGGKGVALHELLHAVGFGHEHSRPDRDAFISIAWSHVLPGFEGNFVKSRSANTLVGYDYSSVLHYGRYAFSRGAEPTITPLQDPRAVLGQRRGLSASDVARVNRLYGCPQGPLTSGTPLSVGTRTEATGGVTAPTAEVTAPARCAGTGATTASP
ncbi:astacin-like metalloendopeptidase [Anser cygnoides]|uniref:astacin-like metalloendopeptidase n=1 Tax=Anser cygnoides TaxID=8845 RepID=UPI0034D172B5